MRSFLENAKAGMRTLQGPNEVLKKSESENEDLKSDEWGPEKE
jgi:hypothetical protein